MPWVTIGMDSSSLTGVSVTYQCWHGLEVEPPQWSVQARMQREAEVGSDAGQFPSPKTTDTPGGTP
jgi:hypothetical protein